ncbi:hypothetical protein LQ50_24655 [Halalkalibacter okhensis]|uniref:Uncharacterized protein n=1 Tax=Halalkalibacter okhensis TaxID=333138 RepID=A0A0B0I9H2_9BACI|nr:hypothetical protein LQ50_24655 [Halalkalibacter okhensis]
MFIIFLPIFVELILILVGMFLITLGTWELRLGENRRLFITFILSGVFFIVLSQKFLEIMGILTVFS